MTANVLGAATGAFIPAQVVVDNFSVLLSASDSIDLVFSVGIPDRTRDFSKRAETAELYILFNFYFYHNC